MQRIDLDTVGAYCRLYGLAQSHPLVSVVDLKQSPAVVNNAQVHYGVYALFLKNGAYCTLRYGRREYDCQQGTVVSLAPGQTVEISVDKPVQGPDVVGIVFHPDLILGTPLGLRIREYGFFDYSQLEAVHLSQEERNEFLQCLDNIKRETQRPQDRHSNTVLSALVQVMLEYMKRFYDRQFETRHGSNSEVVSRFEANLKEYFRGEQRRNGIPAVAWFARKANLSPGYFSDLVRKETGSTPKDLISLHILGEAKNRLATGSEDVAEVAYDLGFEYPAHFTRMFKRLTGQSPTQYRANISRQGI